MNRFLQMCVLKVFEFPCKMILISLDFGEVIKVMGVFMDILFGGEVLVDFKRLLFKMKSENNE